MQNVISMNGSEQTPDTDGTQPKESLPAARDPDLPPRVVLKARDRLGLSKKKWDNAAIAAYQQFGKYLNVPITARILLVRDFDSLDQVQNAFEWCGKILADKDSTTEQRLTAIEIQALTATAQVRLSAQIMELAEKAGEKQQMDRPKNLPPQIPVQFNFNGQNPTSVTLPPAKNDVEEPPEK